MVVERIANAAESKMLVHWSFLSTWVCYMLKVRTRFPRTWWIRSNIALDMVFTKVISLAVILYSYLISDILDLLPIYYFPWSYIISIGLGYLYSHAVSNNFAIVINILSSYHTNSNPPVTRSTIVTSFRYNFYFLPLRNMT